MVSQQMTNGQKLAAQKNGRMIQQKTAVGKPRRFSNIEIIAAKKAASPAPEVKKTDAEIVARFKLTTLGQLTTEHMTADNKALFNNLITAVRGWRNEVKENGRLSFIISSPGYGVGKTHIAKAVSDSFAEIAYYQIDPKNVNDIQIADKPIRHGRMLTANQLMAAMESKTLERNPIIRHTTKVFIVDDIGRESVIPYVKQDKDSQSAERQSRYFEFINKCYEWEVPVFMTTNLRISDLPSFFNRATWSRLNEMCPRGYMCELNGFNDYRLMRSGRGGGL